MNRTILIYVVLAVILESSDLAGSGGSEDMVTSVLWALESLLALVESPGCRRRDWGFSTPSHVL